MQNLKISIPLFILIGSFSMLLTGIGSLCLFGILQTNAFLQGMQEDRTAPMAYLAPGLAPEEEKIAKNFAEARTRFLDEWMQLTTTALQNNDVDTARRLLQAASQVLGTAGQKTGTEERENL